MLWVQGKTFGSMSFAEFFFLSLRRLCAPWRLRNVSLCARVRAHKALSLSLSRPLSLALASLLSKKLLSLSLLSLTHSLLLSLLLSLSHNLDFFFEQVVTKCCIASQLNKTGRDSQDPNEGQRRAERAHI
jgi:hypothetical protein